MSAAAPAPKKASAAKKAGPAGPTYESMIKEAIIAHPEDARKGIGRQTVKKYIQTKHPNTAAVSPAQFNNLVNNAIKKGAEKGVFVLPKGVSGSVKLAPKAKEAPKKKPAVKKPAAKKTTTGAAKPKKTTTAKKATTTTKAKKPAAKKTASSTTKKAAAKPAVAKKPAAKKAAAPKKLTRPPLVATQAAAPKAKKA